MSDFSPFPLRLPTPIKRQRPREDLDATHHTIEEILSMAVAGELDRAPKLFTAQRARMALRILQSANPPLAATLERILHKMGVVTTDKSALLAAGLAVDITVKPTGYLLIPVTVLETPEAMTDGRIDRVCVHIQPHFITVYNECTPDEQHGTQPIVRLDGRPSLRVTGFQKVQNPPGRASRIEVNCKKLLDWPFREAVVCWDRPYIRVRPKV